MDELQFLYRSYMRPFKDRPDVLLPGRWRWCAEGAVRVPFAHRFTSSLLLPDDVKGMQVVGEVFDKFIPVADDPIPRYTGQTPCGSLDAWQNGILYADRGTPVLDWDGVPACCGARPAPPGGALLGGDAVQEIVTGTAFDEGFDIDHDAPG
jgi:hypothetical protein